MNPRGLILVGCGPEARGLDYLGLRAMNGHSEPTTMEKLRGPNIVKRGEQFLRTWKHLASDQENFAGIDYQELHAEVDGAKEARERVQKNLVKSRNTVPESQ